MNHARIAWLASLLLISICSTAHAQGNISAAEQQLNSIISEYWGFHLAENPIEATQIGLNDYNDRMPSVSPADQLRQLEAEQSFLRRTRDIDSDELSFDGHVNADLFEWVLEDSIGAYKLNLSRIPFNTFSQSEYERPSGNAVQRFWQVLVDAGYIVTVRSTRGDDIDAACGQLVGQVVDKTRRAERYRKAGETQIINVGV